MPHTRGARMGAIGALRHLSPPGYPKPPHPRPTRQRGMGEAARGCPGRWPWGEASRYRPTVGHFLRASTKLTQLHNPCNPCMGRAHGMHQPLQPLHGLDTKPLHPLHQPLQRLHVGAARVAGDKGQKGSIKEPIRTRGRDPPKHVIPSLTKPRQTALRPRCNPYGASSPGERSLTPPTCPDAS